ncbi:MAG: zinc ribbon domain-containing protein [Chloroflexi bacterium]|nr:zinc ribbon domain-containing protein [Chloroflexota bacterium]
MTIPGLETITSFLTIVAAVMGALLAALWLSLVIWAFRDMRSRSRDPFAQILAALVVAALPFVGLIIYFILRPPETLAEAYERALEEEALLQEIEERPSCPGCSRTIDANWILCPYCHTRLRKACPDCHSLMELSWNLCPFCGNQHIDLYHVPLPTTEANPTHLPDFVAPADESSPNTLADESDEPTAVSPALENQPDT